MLLPVAVKLCDSLYGNWHTGPGDFSNIAADTPEMVDLQKPGSICLCLDYNSLKADEIQDVYKVQQQCFQGQWTTGLG